MPPRNPWLTDSVYPTSHFNPAASDSVCSPDRKKKRNSRGQGRKSGIEAHGSNPAVKKIGADTVIFASGTLGIRKILATGKSFEALSFKVIPGMEELAAKADDKAVSTLLTESMRQTS